MTRRTLFRFGSLLALALLFGCTASYSPDPTPREPVAKIVGPLTGVVGEPILFDASESVDPDGRIWRYIFQIGDLQPRHVMARAQFQFVFDAPGSYTVFVTVVDEGGNQALGQTTIQILPGSGVTPGSDANTGQDTTVGVDFGLPPGDANVNPTMDTTTSDSTEPTKDVVPLDCVKPEGKYTGELLCDNRPGLKFLVNLQFPEDKCITEIPSVLGQLTVKGDYIRLTSSLLQGLGIQQCDGTIVDLDKIEMKCNAACTVLLVR